MTTENNQHLEKLSDYVTLTVEHQFTDRELLKKSSELAALTREIDLQTEKKKTTAAKYKNEIDILKAQVKLVSDAITNKWENQDRACELYLDFENKIRIYDDKITGDELKREPFHQSDFEKRQLKMDLDAQIEYNNAVGDCADQEPDENGMYIGNDGNLTDIKPLHGSFDPIDKVIADKSKEKPTPKNNLGDYYNKNEEFESELPDDDDLLKPVE